MELHIRVHIRMYTHTYVYVSILFKHPGMKLYIYPGVKLPIRVQNLVRNRPFSAGIYKLLFCEIGFICRVNRVARHFLMQYTKMGKTRQMTTKYLYKIDQMRQMATKYTK
jgi:hypothetical protein